GGGSSERAVRQSAVRAVRNVHTPGRTHRGALRRLSRKTSRDRPCHPARQPSLTITPTRITRPTRDCLGPDMWERCINNREARGEGRHFLVGRHLMATAVDTATTAPSIPKQTSRTRAATALYACRIRTPPSWQ